MAAGSVQLPDGSMVTVPPGLTPDETAAYLSARGVPAEMLGDMAPPDAAGDYRMPSAGVLGDLFAGAGTAILRRALGPGFGVRAPETLAAGIGASLPMLPLAAAAPAAGIPGMLAQGALSAGYEAMDPASTAGSIGTAGAFGALGTGAADLTSRVLSGAWRTARAFMQQQAVRTTSEGLRTTANAAGGNAIVDVVNRRAMTAAAARSIGLQATELRPQQLQAAADQIGQQFDALLPPGRSFDLSAVEQALQGIQQGGVGVRTGRAVNSVTDWANVPGDQVRALRAALAERGRSLMGDAPALADDLLAATDLIDDAAELIIGPNFRPALRQAREQWKNLRILESLPSVRRGGTVAAGELSQRLARDSAGYGTSFLRDTRNVLPATQGMFDLARQLTEDAAGRIGNPGTAPALVGTAGLGMGAGLLTGATTPGAALAGLGAVGGAQAAGMGAVGTALPPLSAAAGQAAGQAAVTRE